MPQVRPAFTSALVLVLLGAVAAAAIPVLGERLDRPQRERASVSAAAMSAPAGAVESTVCRGDGQVACWQVNTPVADVAIELSAALGATTDQPVVRTCDEVPLTTTVGPSTTTSCFVRVRFGDHGAFAFVDPWIERDDDGIARVVGALVTVSAS